MGTWAGHWHGYGPWTGPSDALKQEEFRRPGNDATEAGRTQTQAFIRGSMPPVMTGWALMRRPGANRTWTNVADALAWLEATYQTHPRVNAPADALAVKLGYAADFLGRGSDDVWAYYVPGYSFVSFEVICCPNLFHPKLACPRPPAMSAPG